MAHIFLFRAETVYYNPIASIGQQIVQTKTVGVYRTGFSDIALWVNCKIAAVCESSNIYIYI